MITVERVKTAADAAELDDLLWSVLWRPLGLPRDIRSTFHIDGEEIELAAKQDGRIVGGLVPIATVGDEMELRHLAVASGARGKAVGRRLVTELVRIASANMRRRIHTIARNTSADFFREVGFKPSPGRAPEHPLFLEHGITFELMQKIVEPDSSADD